MARGGRLKNYTYVLYEIPDGVILTEGYTGWTAQ